MAKRVLVAGIGNVFLGDDGFGVEVIARLGEEAVPAGVEVADYGIRGYDLAFSLMDGYGLAISSTRCPEATRPASYSCSSPTWPRSPGRRRWRATP